MERHRYIKVCNRKRRRLIFYSQILKFILLEKRVKLLSYTPNYNLQTWNTSETGDIFNNFLFGVAGDAGSNMTKIDAAMNTTNTLVNSLRSYTARNISATRVSDNYYEAVVENYSSYEFGNIFILESDTTSDGAYTLNINSIGTVSVMKYDSSGTIQNIEANDITANSPVLIQYDGVRWVLIANVGHSVRKDNPHNVLATQITDLLSKTYPVGTLYLSVNANSPANLFGGTWERIKDRFLLSAGDSYDAGSIGGEATHTLAISELPEHYHGTSVARSAGDPVTWPTSSFIGRYSADAGGTSFNINTASVGSGIAHNNMPPYLAVYVWKRIE